MKTAWSYMKSGWKKIKYFFPFNLLFLQFKYNIVLLFYWLFLFLIINQQTGTTFGLPYLFLSPEYHGSTSFISFFLLGLSLGGFIMAFHAYSYIHLGAKYPFIATLERPFFKFCINNSLLPLLFFLNFSFNVFYFQIQQELTSSTDAILFVSALLLGAILFIALAFLYFFPTNKDIFKISGKSKEEFNAKSNIGSTLHKNQTWYSDFLAAADRQYYYIGKNFKLKQSRSCRHYDIRILRSVFAQNHTNASFFEIALVVSFGLIGFFKDFEAFQVPASVSLMMLFTIIIMLISALFSWVNRWAYPIIIVLLFGLNYLSIYTSSFNFKSEATGLSYEEGQLVPFTPERVRQIGFNQSEIDKDKLSYFEILDQWKQKQPIDKPKLVLLNTSGGGLRSALWTFTVLQSLDSLTKSKFGNSLQMITGASGGMIGAAYYRELMLQHSTEKLNKLDQKHKENIGKDLLNRISFSLSTNDIFFRFHKAEHNGMYYTKDRGFAFEQELINNLDSTLDKSLGDYCAPERKAQIPTMIFSPTIINDGRRLIVSAQHLSFLNELVIQSPNFGLYAELENVEFLKYFSDIQPENIYFPTVLRMNATFPYILPMVTLPTQPGMHIMDAGIRDNYGTKISVQFLIALEDWIKKNTSGVVLVKIRDTKKILLSEKYKEIGLFNKFLLPFGNLYGNFPRVQDFDQDELIMTLQNYWDIPLDVVTFNLRENIEEQIALSWHLTKQEKQKIASAFQSPANQRELKKLIELLQFDEE